MALVVEARAAGLDPEAELRPQSAVTPNGSGPAEG